MPFLSAQAQAVQGKLIAKNPASGLVIQETEVKGGEEGGYQEEEGAPQAEADLKACKAGMTAAK